MTIDVKDRVCIPITVEFTDENDTAITVEFGAKYRKRKKSVYASDNGYTGEIIVNDLL